MIRSLRVKNLALIREAEVLFDRGLNILSGETGAGKSILIGSLDLAFGGRAEKEMLRRDADFAMVELICSIENAAQAECMRQIGIEPEDGEVIFCRIIHPSGRSSCRINAQTVPVSVHAGAVSCFLDIYGQQEHLALRAKKNHIKYLDGYAGEAAALLKERLEDLYENFCQSARRLKEADVDPRERRRELSFLRHEISMIEATRLKPGEDAELESEFKKMREGERIIETLGKCREYCFGGEGSADEQIGRAARLISELSGCDIRIESMAASLSEAEDLLRGFGRDTEEYLRESDFSPEHYQALQERLDAINQLKSMFGGSIEEILDQAERKRARADEMERHTERMLELSAEYQRDERELKACCAQLTALRKEYGESLEKELKSALTDLNFREIKLKIEQTCTDSPGRDGWDEVRFLLSANPGEPMRPLDKIASGGELSRIMLGLKTVLAQTGERETMVFDEIDSGISGRTAQMVGEKIKEISRAHQVICITHLPQIAAMADAHFLIEKSYADDSTVSRIARLDEEGSVKELARMLGGAQITDAVMKNARELRKAAIR